MSQSSSISIFSSKEQEYEQKAQLLKRLAYVILCSEMDQYHKYMPEIQGEPGKYIDTYFVRVRVNNFCIPFVTRAAGRQSKATTSDSIYSGASVPLFPGTTSKNVAAACHFLVASNCQRTCSSLPIH